ncbi:hypothetical protein [Nocardioides sp. InS609-2]|uniref:hypothetical protein n=1 Tax=Nocardioides sp. InS609-2 TaxID=2760705 RepID=UPI0020C0A168|nr:hypothetical protein [Nocardioides sp. InS609-2]
MADQRGRSPGHELTQHGGDPGVQRSNGLATGDGLSRVGPVVLFRDSPRVVVPATLEAAQALLPQPMIKLRGDAQGVAEDPCGLDRANQVTCDEPLETFTSFGEVSRNDLRGSACLFTAHVGEWRVRRLALGESTHIPLRLTVSDEVDASHRVDPPHDVEKQGQD